MGTELTCVMNLVGDRPLYAPLAPGIGEVRSPSSDHLGPKSVALDLRFSPENETRGIPRRLVTSDER
jgi:hypothetical protein